MNASLDDIIQVIKRFLNLKANDKDVVKLTTQTLTSEQQTQVCKNIGAISKNDRISGLPIGHMFNWPYQTAPDYSIVCNGGMYSRAAYKDLFDLISSKQWIKPESQWQQIASSSNGFCPYYSDGDGSTTFRTPKFAPYQQIVADINQATSYHRAGVPDLQGQIPIPGESQQAVGGILNGVFEFVNMNGIKVGNDGFAPDAVARFRASRYNSVYGGSNTVTPESHSWVVCVVAK